MQSIEFMKKTSTDQFILQTLSEQNEHLTALKVFEAVQKKLPAINPSTVYRALDRLVEQGKVSVSDMGLGAAVFELTSKELHHHLVCQKCGEILMLDDEAIRSIFKQLENEFGYEIKTNHLVLFGVCRHCKDL